MENDKINYHWTGEQVQWPGLQEPPSAFFQPFLPTCPQASSYLYGLYEADLRFRHIDGLPLSLQSGLAKF
jgi:hypothetical protein